MSQFEGTAAYSLLYVYHRATTPVKEVNDLASRARKVMGIDLRLARVMLTVPRRTRYGYIICNSAMYSCKG